MTQDVRRARARAAVIIAVIRDGRNTVGTSVDLPIWVQARRRINWRRREH